MSNVEETLGGEHSPFGAGSISEWGILAIGALGQRIVIEVR